MINIIGEYPIDYETFKEVIKTLQETDENATFFIQSPVSCPIAYYLEQHDRLGISFSVTTKKVRVQQNYYSLPKWATDFIKLVDNYKKYRAESRTISLDEIEDIFDILDILYNEDDYNYV